MYIFKKNKDLRKFLNQEKISGKSVGFVPTMGALHNGHLSLIKRAKQENDITVCSVFVNPTQFNNEDDLVKYPITITSDIDLLESVNCDVLYLPAVEDVYPKDLDTTVDIDLGTLTQTMEGPYRPGHFEGVLQVVKRLLDIVEPNRIYMGQKDFQQWRIISRMSDVLGMGVEVVGCEIVRAESGLAMSSRNMRLSEEERELATILYKTLSISCTKIKEGFDINEIKQSAFDTINQAGLVVDYVEIVDMDTLLPVNENNNNLVICLAAYLGEVRLIDNMIVG